MTLSGTADNNKGILDLVNEKDEIIGFISKKEAHAGIPKLHREIGVVIYDRGNNILLQQRSYKKKYFPGKWSITVTGHVLKGENPEQTAHKELIEELGFDTDLLFTGKKKYVTDNHASIGYSYTGLFPKGIMIIPNADEVERAEFVTESRFQELVKNDLVEPHSVEDLTNHFKHNLAK